jgi:hypothetical protein
MYPDTPVIIGGDFNSRVGCLGELNKHLFENSLLIGTRRSSDSIIDSHGKKLIEIMDEANYVLLNGRSNGDYPGKHTFANANGKSTIDLVFINSKASHYFSDLKVLPNADTTHLVIQSQFDNSKNLQATQNQNKNPNYKLRWDVKRRDDYVNQIKYELTRELTRINLVQRVCIPQLLLKQLQRR